MFQYKNPSRIIGIQFGISSPEEIRKAGVVEVVSKDTYINNKEVPGGLFDPRMGVLGPGAICPTDGLSYIQTPGYFGYIEMARPVFFIQHIKEIMKILKCVCFKCSKLLISKEQHAQVCEMSSYHRWDYVYPLCQKVKRCGEQTESGCGCKQPDKIKLDGMSTINAIWENLVNEGAATAEGKDGKSNYVMKLTAEIVLKIFKRISDEDVEFMGFSATWSRPDWMICQVLPVAPPAVRPSVKMDANQRSEDDLTHIYGHIIKTNRDLMERINANASPHIIDNLTSVLQYFVAMIVNNKVKGAVPMAQRTGRPLQCITGRLNSKNGRIRGNLMGKRVDFSARSVITGDPNLSARQLGVPLRVAMCLTKPVVVNDRNRNFLTKLVQNGPETYPGAKILEKKDGSNVSLRYVDRSSIRLENGDKVHRHMMDGDAVLFNRQPSLHRMSMMCHIVKVMKRGDTFRMNVCDTKPYNADFDGDEMNMHMPQSELSETELRNLAAIPYQIISPSSNAPIIGIFQDSMLGSYQFTRKGVEFTPRQAMNILMGYSNVDMKELRNKKKITNFDILSQITPPISLKYKTKLFDDAEDPNVSNNVLEIHNGKYVRGQADKGVFASGTKGILNRICNDFGNMACSNYIDDLQQVITEYMKTSAYSVGVSDLVSDRKTTESVLQVISSKMNEVAELTDKVHLGILENNSGKTNAQEFEVQVGNILNDATSQTGKIGVKSLDESNRFVKIVKSGSKGSMLNISQMISCLGQQSVDGKRVPYGFDNRTLPHFKKFDDSPEARGFVKNSYISGLTAPELFFHAMGGRMGLIDTAVKTSQTGYIQRRLVKGLEDLKVEYDGTVRNNMGKIVQFTYGEDGVDTTRVENQNINLVNMSIEDIYMYYDLIGLNDGENKDMLNIYTKETIKRFKAQREKTKAKCKESIDQLIHFRDELVANVFKFKNEDAIKAPVAFQYIIQNIQGQMNLTANNAVDITPLEFIETIEKTMLRLKSTFKVTRLFEIMYFYSLSPKELLIKKRFNTRAVALLMEHIVLAYKKSIVHPGEMVGVIAGQSIGEPTTQLTLNSFVYETEILVRNGAGEIKCVQIGDFTTSGIKTSRKLDYMEDKDTTYAELSEFYEVPSATEDGQTVWRKIEAVTKHPVVNEDGTNTMLKITTKGCRELIATKAKSFLKLVDGKIIGVEGKDLAVGDYLPVSKLILSIQQQTIETSEIIPNTVNGILTMEPRDGRCVDLEFDKIVSIEEVQNTTAYAYDLTVEDTRNFDCANGLCVRDTFHLAGVATKSNVTRGVPRIEEILRLTRNPDKPSATVFLKPADQHDKDKAANYCNMIQHTKLVDVVKSVEICFDPNDYNSKIEADQVVLQEFYEFEKLVEECNGSTAAATEDTVQKSKWIIRMEIDAESLLDKNITMDDIHFAISNSHKAEVSCVFSDMNSNNLLFRIRLNSSVFKKKKGAVESLDQSDEIYLLKNFQDGLLNNIVLRGVNNITNVNPRMLKDMTVKEDSKYVRKDMWILDTVGSNLLDIFALDFIDYTRTYSNDIREMYDVLGIEAARQNILNEFNEVMEASDAYVNYHHLSILCDRMTVKAEMVPMFRSGIINDDIGPISKSTYEMHTEIFLDASRHGDFDQMRGVSANVMCGQTGFYGTNAFSLLLDMKAIMQLEEAQLKEEDQNRGINFITNGEDMDTDTNLAKIDIENNVKNIQSVDIGKMDDDYDLF